MSIYDFSKYRSVRPGRRKQRITAYKVFFMLIILTDIYTSLYHRFIFTTAATTTCCPCPSSSSLHRFVVAVCPSRPQHLASKA